MVSYVLCFQKLLVDWTQCAYDNVLSTSKIYTFLRHYSNLSPKLLCKVVFLFLSWQSCASISVYEYSMMLLLFPTRVLFPSVHTDNIYIIYSLSHYSTYTTIDNEPKCILSFEFCKVFFLLPFNTVRTPAKHSTKLKEIKHIYSTMVTVQCSNMLLYCIIFWPLIFIWRWMPLLITTWPLVLVASINAPWYVRVYLDNG